MKLIGKQTILAICFVVPMFAHAKAPVGRYTVNAAAGTVYDNWWKLTWQRTPSVGTYTWSATAASGSAQAYCAALSLGGGGWRLPKIKELASLVDRQEIYPTIDQTVFPSNPAANFWSATPYQQFGSAAWIVAFTYGTTNWDSIADVIRVRCVR